MSWKGDFLAVLIAGLIVAVITAGVIIVDRNINGEMPLNSRQFTVLED